MNKAVRMLALVGLLAVPTQAAPMLTLVPADGALRGLPGSTVGWGFTLTNTSDFLVVTGSSFTASPLGTYEDFISSGPNLIVVGPSPESPTVTQLFDPASRMGIGAFHILDTAPAGVSIKGTLTIDYSLFSVSPNDPAFNPDLDTVVADASLSQAAAVQVLPEPGSWILILSGIGLCAAIHRQRRRVSI